MKKKSYNPTDNKGMNSKKGRLIQKAFLEAMCRGLTPGGAAQAAGISRATAYSWRDKSEEFAEAWDAAYEAGSDSLEDEIRRRAQDGVAEPMQHQGHPTGAWVYPDGSIVPDSVLVDPDVFNRARKKDNIWWRPNVVLKYSDSLAMFLMKGRRPSKFKDRHEHSGPGGGPIDVNVNIAFVDGEEGDDGDIES